MTEKPTPSIMHHFSSIEDPRVNRQKKHKLQDIFFISLCAVICGTNNWLSIEEFGAAKEQWFTEMLGLEHGIPSRDSQRTIMIPFVVRLSNHVHASTGSVQTVL